MKFLAFFAIFLIVAFPAFAISWEPIEELTNFTVKMDWNLLQRKFTFGLHADQGFTSVILDLAEMMDDKCELIHIKYDGEIYREDGQFFRFEAEAETNRFTNSTRMIYMSIEPDYVHLQPIVESFIEAAMKSLDTYTPDLSAPSPKNM